MKKTYIAPEVEIKRFNTEDIMSASAITAFGKTDEAGAGVDAAEIEYSDLFSL